MTTTVTMLQTRLGENGTFWQAGQSYPATDGFAAMLITSNLATGTLPFNPGLQPAYINPQTQSVVSGDGSPVAGSVITQPVKTANYTLVPSDSGTIIPVTGTVTITLNADSNLTAPVELRRDNAGTLGVTQTGVTAINPATGSAWGTLSVANDQSSIIITPATTADKYSAVKVGA